METEAVRVIGTGGRGHTHPRETLKNKKGAHAWRDTNKKKQKRKRKGVNAVNLDVTRLAFGILLDIKC